MTHPGINACVGANIRRERKGQGMQLRELARRSGYSLSLISQAELGQAAVSVAALCHIAHALGVQAGTLLAGTREVLSPPSHREMQAGDL